MSFKTKFVIAIMCGCLIGIMWSCNGHFHVIGATQQRTTVRCGGGPEHTINFVPQSRSGQRVATCREGQTEFWYDNATTDRWRYFTDKGGVFAIRVAWVDNSHPDKFFGPIRPGAALETLEFHPGDGGAVPPQVIYKPVGGKTIILNQRKLEEVNQDLDAGKEAR